MSEAKSRTTEPIVLSAKQEKTLLLLDKTAEILDNRFRIPILNVRFGIDSLIGLVPYVGDMAGFAVSGLLLIVMARNGASGMVALKMVGNILLDSAVGIIPILGDLFDFRYKANTRNVRLLQEHYREGRHQGSAWWVLLVVFLALVGALFFMVFVVWKIAGWLFAALFGT
ncbi:MAG: DUF4112 domain-containing protein [Saprospiraceae bacterium]